MSEDAIVISSDESESAIVIDSDDESLPSISDAEAELHQLSGEGRNKSEMRTALSDSDHEKNGRMKSDPEDLPKISFCNREERRLQKRIKLQHIHASKPLECSTERKPPRVKKKRRSVDQLRSQQRAILGDLFTADQAIVIVPKSPQRSLVRTDFDRRLKTPDSTKNRHYDKHRNRFRHSSDEFSLSNEASTPHRNRSPSIQSNKKRSHISNKKNENKCLQKSHSYSANSTLVREERSTTKLERSLSADTPSDRKVNAFSTSGKRKRSDESDMGHFNCYPRVSLFDIFDNLKIDKCEDLKNVTVSTTDIDLDWPIIKRNEIDNETVIVTDCGTNTSFNSVKSDQFSDISEAEEHDPLEHLEKLNPDSVAQLSNINECDEKDKSKHLEKFNSVSLSCDNKSSILNEQFNDISEDEQSGRSEQLEKSDSGSESGNEQFENTISDSVSVSEDEPLENSKSDLVSVSEDEPLENSKLDSGSMSGDEPLENSGSDSVSADNRGPLGNPTNKFAECVNVCVDKDALEMPKLMISPRAKSVANYSKPMPVLERFLVEFGANEEESLPDIEEDSELGENTVAVSCTQSECREDSKTNGAKSDNIFSMFTNGSQFLTPASPPTSLSSVSTSSAGSISSVAAITAISLTDSISSAALTSTLVASSISSAAVMSSSTYSISSAAVTSTSSVGPMSSSVAVASSVSSSVSHSKSVLKPIRTSVSNECSSLQHTQSHSLKRKHGKKSPIVSSLFRKSVQCSSTGTSKSNKRELSLSAQMDQLSLYLNDFINVTEKKCAKKYYLPENYKCLMICCEEVDGGLNINSALDYVERFSRKYIIPCGICNSIIDSAFHSNTSVIDIHRSYKVISTLLTERAGSFDVTWETIEKCLKVTLDNTGINTDVQLLQATLLLELNIKMLKLDLYTRDLTDSGEIRRSLAYDTLMKYWKSLIYYLNKAVHAGQCTTSNRDMYKLPDVLLLLQDLFTLCIEVSSSCIDFARTLSAEMVNTYKYLPRLGDKKRLIQSMTSPLLQYKLVQCVLEGQYDGYQTIGSGFPDSLEDLVQCFFKVMPLKNPMTPPTTPTDESFDMDGPFRSIFTPADTEEIAMLCYFGVVSYLSASHDKLYMALRLRANVSSRLKKYSKEDRDLLLHMEDHVAELESHLRGMNSELTPQTEHFLFLLVCHDSLGM